MIKHRRIYTVQTHLGCGTRTYIFRSRLLEKMWASIPEFVLDDITVQEIDLRLRLRLCLVLFLFEWFVRYLGCRCRFRIALIASRRGSWCGLRKLRWGGFLGEHVSFSTWRQGRPADAYIFDVANQDAALPESGIDFIVVDTEGFK